MGDAAYIIAKNPPLQDLSDAEWNVSSLAPSRTVYRSFWREKLGVAPELIRREGFQGHAIFSNADPACVDAYIRCLPAVGNASSIIVHLTGPMTSAEKALHCRSVRIRRLAVRGVISWLGANNVKYSNVPVSNALMTALPYDGYPDGTIIHSGTVVEASALPSGEVTSPVVEMSGVLTSSLDDRLLSDRLRDASRNMDTDVADDADVDAPADAPILAPGHAHDGHDSEAVPGAAPVLSANRAHPVCSTCNQPAAVPISPAQPWLCANAACLMHGLNVRSGVTDSSGGAPQAGTHRASYSLGRYAQLWVKSNWPRFFPSLFLYGRGGPDEPGLEDVTLKAYVHSLAPSRQ